MRLAPVLALAIAAAPLGAQQSAIAPAALVYGASADAALCGLDVLDTNPAGLGVTCESAVAGIRAIFPPTIAASAFSNGPNTAIWESRGDLLDGLDGGLDFGGIPAAERQAILDGIPATGWQSGGQVTVPLIALHKGRLGFSAITTLQLGATVPRDAVELLLQGWDDRLAYDVTDFDASVLAVSSYTLGYALRPAPGLTVGATGSLLTGTANGSYHAAPVVIDPIAQTAVLPIVGGFAGGKVLEGSAFDLKGPDGLGYAIDLGARYTRRNLHVAFAVENLLADMGWPEQTVTVTTSVEVSPAGVATTVARDTFATPVPETTVLRSRLDAFTPPTRLRSAVAWDLSTVTVAFGRVDETGDGRLLATGSGWDLGLGLHPLSFLDVQGSVGEWRGLRTYGAGLSLRLGSFLLQGAVKDWAGGRQLAASIAIAP